MAVELLIDVPNKVVQFYALTSATKGCGRQIVDAVVEVHFPGLVFGGIHGLERRVLEQDGPGVSKTVCMLSVVVGRTVSGSGEGGCWCFRRALHAPRCHPNRLEPTLFRHRQRVDERLLE